MSTKCWNCDQTLLPHNPDIARYCWNCGAPRKQGDPWPGPTNADRDSSAEACQIQADVTKVDNFGRYQVKFVAASNSNAVAFSPEFRIEVFPFNATPVIESDDANAKAALQDLRDELSKYGWKETGQGELWYEYRYSR